MALLDAFRPAAALSELLDKERDALLKSDFSTLESLAKPKEKLMSLVARAQTSAATLRVLQRRVERNRRLLMASAKGIQTARDRLVALKSNSNEFTTYGPAGTPTSISRKSLTMKKKA